MSRTVALLAGVAAALSGCAAPAAAALPPIKHVFVIVLENKNYDVTFGPGSEAPYLSKELTARGQLLTNYYGTSHLSLGNYISMVSGQAANPDTQGDCMMGFKDIVPGTVGPDGQTIGVGCVYPKPVQTIANQLEAKGLTWKGYMQDMGNTPGAPQTCRHPAIGANDDTQQARPTDHYATRHNPFVYFHSIIDSPTCDANDVPLDRLPADLSGSTANFSFIVPSLCDDGHDTPCADKRPGGLVSADAFLKTWVPKIEASPAFKDSGMLLITFDEAENSSAEACCGEMPGPSSPSPGITGPGGGRIGAVVLSPWVEGGTQNKTPYNHYALLRSVEDLFALGHLGFAGQSGLKAFGEDVYNGPGPSDKTKAKSGCGKTTFRVVRSTNSVTLVIRSARKRVLRMRLHRKGHVVTIVRTIPACGKASFRLPGRHGKVGPHLGRIWRGIRY
jgi:hypothetical protein